MESIYPLLSPHQKVYIVPGSFATHDPRTKGPGAAYPFGNKTYCYSPHVVGDDQTSESEAAAFQGCDEYMRDQANAYGRWALSDSRVAGIAPWHWDSREIGVVTPFKEVGVVDMPLTKAAWQAIGLKFQQR